MKNKIWTGLVVVLVIGSIGYFILNNSLIPNRGGNGYKAVFLTNGQVYFGKIANETSDPIVVTDVFYPRLSRQNQSKPNETSSAAKLQLVKLGFEFHAPKDEMRIRRDAITFIEDLKDDGQVVKLINDYKDRGGESAFPETSPSAQISPIN